MALNPWPFTNASDPLPSSAEVMRAHRARLALEEEERVYRRQLELAEQRSNENPPEVRIRAWEKVHGLSLPSDPAHPILDVIAVGTRLTLDQIQAEQRARALRRRARGETQTSMQG